MRDEILPLVDEDGMPIGRAPRRECHRGPGRLHPVVHLHVFSSQGEIFLQRRAAIKDTFPGRWDTAVGGHMACGEEVEAALRREAFEELGLSGFLPGYVGSHIVANELESEYVYTFVTVHDGPFRLNPDEISAGRFWSAAEIEAHLDDATFTPNFVADYRMLQQYRLQSG